MYCYFTASIVGLSGPSDGMKSSGLTPLKSPAYGPTAPSLAILCPLGSTIIYYHGVAERFPEYDTGMMGNRRVCAHLTVFLF